MITSVQPNVKLDARYSIGDTCKALGIHRCTLLRYTEAGMIKCGFRRENGRKFYSGNEIVRFWKAKL